MSKPIKPAYPYPNLTREEGCEKLKAYLREFFYHYTRHMSAVHGMREEPNFDDALSQYASLHWQIKAPAGMGKTRGVIEHLRKIPASVVWVVLPTLNMAQQFADDMESNAPEHIEVQLIKGRGADGMCDRGDIWKNTAASGFQVQESVCKKDDKKCTYYAFCKYQEQMRILAALKEELKKDWKNKTVILVMAHEYLSLFTPFLPNPDLIIADESHWQKLIKEYEVGLGDMTKIAVKHGKDNAEFNNLTGKITPLLSATIPNLLQVKKAGVTAECLDKGIKFLSTTINKIKHASGVSPDKSNIQILNAITAMDMKTLISCRELLQSMKEEMVAERGLAHSYYYDGDKVVISRMEKLSQVARRAAVLLLDASADTEINQRIWGKLVTREISVDRHAEVIQVKKKAFPYSELLIIKEELSEEKKQSVLKLQEEIVQFVNSLSGNILLVASKRVEEVLIAAGLRGGIKTAHFSNLRGINKFEDCDTVVVVGREQPSSIEVEKYARAIWHDIPNNRAILLGQGLVKKAVGRRMHGGIVEEEEVQIHPNEKVQRVMYQIREREIEQAVDRVRLIHNDKKKTVYLFTSVVIDITVDKSLRWAELKAGGSKLERALQKIEKQAKVFPLGYTDMSFLFPEVWKTPDSAKTFIREGGGSDAWKKWVKIQISDYWQNDPLRLVEYRHKGQRGKSSYAYVSASDDEVKVMLEKVFGELALCRVIDEE